MELLSSTTFWIALGSIILTNIVLSGDNAVVIALASRNLPPAQQKRAIFWGSAAAIIMRVVLTVAAAEAAAKRGLSVILVEPTSSLGGQFTAQMVPVPDENSHIEKPDGPSTDSYRDLRAYVRNYYAGLPGIKPGREQNVGMCWVSRVSGTPGVWEDAVHARLRPYYGPRGIKTIYLRHQIQSAARYANGRFAWADIVNLDNGRVTRIGAQYLLDATEDGEALHLAGAPLVIGQEAKSEYGEPHAPETARPDWVQSFTYCFSLRWAAPDEPRVIVEKPEEYEYFKSLGEYTLDYVYSERGTVTYKVLERAEGSGGPFWSYRRLLWSNSFEGTPASPVGDVALMNWRGNDFHEESYLGKSPEEQVRILKRGKAFAQGFLHWLQTECPRDDGNGVGYPEMQLAGPAVVPGVGQDGFALHPYVRESRRLKAKFTLTENHLTSPDPKARWGEAFFDSVGCALYAVDIHPSKGEPPLLVPALPYHIPLGSFLPASGPPNVLPAAKNFGASRLALASARMHPTEWLVGQVAGSLAAFCLQRHISDPTAVRETPELLSAFQDQLRRDGVTLYWSDILPPPPPENATPPAGE